MREQEPAEAPYWQHNLRLGEARVLGANVALGLRLHVAQEEYRRHQELVPLQHARGIRTYVHGRAYFREPLQSASLAIPREIGQAQAFYYPADATLILWECYLFDWCRDGNPSDDETLSAFWTGFERLLLTQITAAPDRIVTPSWEPIYEQHLWHEFLRGQGYQPFNERAFVKRVPSA